MQPIHQALLLKKLYLLKAMGFDYCDLHFKKPTQKQFQSTNLSNLNQVITTCHLCAQRLSSPHIGLCNPNSKLLFVSLFPILDVESRFISNGAQMLKKIIENVFALSFNEVSIISLLKCDVPLDSQNDCLQNCMGYFLKQLEFSGAKNIILLGEEVYLSLTKDKTPYKNIQGKILQWNKINLFPTFSVKQLLLQPNLKIRAHKEFLTLKGHL